MSKKINFETKRPPFFQVPCSFLKKEKRKTFSKRQVRFESFRARVRVRIEWRTHAWNRVGAIGQDKYGVYFFWTFFSWLLTWCSRDNKSVIWWVGTTASAAFVGSNDDGFWYFVYTRVPNVLYFHYCFWLPSRPARSFC